MKQHIVVFAVLLVLVLVALVFMKPMEGFAAQERLVSTIPKCPTGFKFFNGPKGDSFCCRGTVNPYTHTCETHTAPTDGALCAFVRTKDPLSSIHDLPLCSSLLADQVTAGTAKCPNALPNWVSDAPGSEKCCKSPSDNGLECLASDTEAKAYCILEGPVGAGEKSCAELNMLEGAECPKNAGFAKFTYPLGAREVRSYGKAAEGLTMPVCSRVNDTCIPDAAIEYLQEQNIFNDKDLTNWKWACSVWDRVVNKGDKTFTPDESYPQ